MHENPQHQVLAQFEVDAGAGGGVAIGGDRAFAHRRGAAADRALDAVFDHEIQAARAGADHRLPAFDRQVDRPRHQRQFLQRIAAIGHFGRQRVMLALVRKALVVEGFQDDLDLLLEQFAVGLLVMIGAPNVSTSRE